MQDSKKGLLPFRYGVHLSKQQSLKTPQEVEDMRHIPYASVVGSMMYVCNVVYPTRHMLCCGNCQQISVQFGTCSLDCC